MDASSSVSVLTATSEAASGRSAAAGDISAAAQTAASGQAAAVGPEPIAPTFPILPVLLVLALLALVLALLYVLRLRRRLKESEAALHAPKAEAERGCVRSLRVGKLHEQGKREYQQDAFGLSHESLLNQHGQLAVVADGMGGLAESDRVSIAAVETILDQFSLSQGEGEPRALLLQLAADARRAVNAMLQPGELGKSGSTLVMALIRNEFLHWFSVGDSRICLLRDGALFTLNREHIYENELALRAVNGRCEVEDAFSDPHGVGLISFLGMDQLKAIDYPTAPIRLRPGDKVILMTDGVYNALDEETLIPLLEKDPEDAAQQLREAIEECAYSNQDNYTAVILECLGNP